MSIIQVTIDGQSFEIDLRSESHAAAEFMVTVNGEPVRVFVPESDDPERMEWIIIDDRPYEIVLDRDLHWVKSRYGLHHLEIRDLEAAVSRPASRDSRVKAPIPGLVTRVLVEQGSHVEAGQPIMVLEAMKMENEVRAPRSGVIAQLSASPGQKVQLNEVLAEIAEAAG